MPTPNVATAAIPVIIYDTLPVGGIDGAGEVMITVGVVSATVGDG